MFEKDCVVFSALLNAFAMVAVVVLVVLLVDVLEYDDEPPIIFPQIPAWEIIIKPMSKSDAAGLTALMCK